MKYFKDFSDYTYLYDYIMRLEKKFFEENKLNDVKFCYSCKDDLKYESGFLEFYGCNIFRNYFDTKKEDNSYNRFKDLVDRKKILVIEGKERYFAIQFHGILKRIGELPTKNTTILIDESEVPKGTIYDEKYRVKKPWVK